MCGRYYFSVDLLDEIRELVEPGDWKLELGLLEKDMHPGGCGACHHNTGSCGAGKCGTGKCGMGKC